MIYTFGDGFAAGHIWPEWPQILEAITQIPVVNFGHIGAGNEYIFNCVIKAALTAKESDLFLVQWADPYRFDKIVEDAQWMDLQQTDPKYKNIKSTVFDQTWWSTSGSDLKEIQKYRNFYIQHEQAMNRSVLYMISASKMLKSLNIDHKYFLTYKFDYSTHGNFSELSALPWIDFQGMDEWTTNTGVRGDEMQPSPQSQLAWVENKLLPYCTFNVDNLNKIRYLINNQKFKPYDPDSAQIWSDITN
jgi:hypothetical protein